MPKLNDTTLAQNALATNHYGYSAVRPDSDTLGASEYTLVSIAIDKSGSVGGFRAELEEALKSIVESCKYSPRADNLLLRVVLFDDTMEELHGFKLLESCHINDYDGAVRVGGSTLLFETSENAISATTDYAEKLKDQKYDSNAIVVIVTDGDDNMSKISAKNVKAALVKAVQSEKLESINSILIGVNVNNSYVSQKLNDFKTEADFTQYVEIDNADAKTLAKLAEFVSHSISAQSQSLGTGGPSQALTF